MYYSLIFDLNVSKITLGLLMYKEKIYSIIIVGYKCDN